MTCCRLRRCSGFRYGNCTRSRASCWLTRCWPNATSTSERPRDMTEQKKTDVARFYDAEAAEYHRMYQRENLETSDRYPANYFRHQILVRRLASLGARRVYEIGVGEGSPLVAMAKLG